MAATQDTQAHEREQLHLTLDISPTLVRPIKEAAARRNQMPDQYVRVILTQVVPMDGVAASTPLTIDKVEHVDDLRARSMLGRVLDDSSPDIMREMRAERLADL